jgi:ABC-type sugar transport system, permease component
MLLLVGFLIVTTPIYILFNISFKTEEEYVRRSIFSIPENIFNISNYLFVFEKGHMLLAFKNILILCTASISISIVLGLMTAYSLDRFDFRLKKYILGAFLVSAMIPSITTQVATFSVIKSLHLLNTMYAGIVIYICVDIIQIYVFLQFIEKIPKELDESAMIDGASYFRIFTNIIIPQMKPAIMTIVILKLLYIYNDYLTPYLYMNKSNLRTVATALDVFSNDQTARWNVMGAAIIIVMIPTLVLYLFLQRYIISGVTDGAVKE